MEGGKDLREEEVTSDQLQKDIEYAFHPISPSHTYLNMGKTLLKLNFP
jgi:hypothetical protein